MLRTALPVLALGVVLALAANVAGGQSSADRIYPRTALFRTAIEVLARRGVPVERVVAMAENYDLIVAKALDEEVLGLQVVAPYLRAIKTRYPDKIVLDHFLFIGRNSVSAQPAVFPGHWMLMNGTQLIADIGPTDTVLAIADSRVLEVGEAVQLTALDEVGRPDFTKVEQVQITEIVAGAVTVVRGAYGSTPLDFRAGRTRVAAHAYVRYTDEVWVYNFCLEGPTDPQGRRLIESLAQKLASYLQPGEILGGLDGYQFDVARFYTRSIRQGNRRFDCDNDGAADAGYINGVSSYGLGSVAFFKTLRGLVGDRIYLISEATGEQSGRDIAYANGMENESFPDLHRWDRFSSAYGRYRDWLNEALEPRLTYLQLKEVTEAFSGCPERDRGTNWKYRLALGATLLGDGYFAFIPIDTDEEQPACRYIDPETGTAYAELDEFKAGNEDRWGYLGAALEAARRVDQARGAELLADGGYESNITGVTIETVGISQAAIARDPTKAARGNASLKISVAKLDGDPADNKVSVTIGTFAVRQGVEYTLRLRVSADPKYHSIDPMFAGIPRRVVFVMAGRNLPRNQPLAQDVMADAAWRVYSLSFVATGDDARATLVVQLGREAGDVWLDDLSLKEGGADVFVRQFEGGVVLVNASVQPVAFDLPALFPGLSLKRISGTKDPGVNSGAMVTGGITLPGRDALILISD